MASGQDLTSSFAEKFLLLNELDSERTAGTDPDFSIQASSAVRDEGLDRYVDAIPYDRSRVHPPSQGYLNASRILPCPFVLGSLDAANRARNGKQSIPSSAVVQAQVQAQTQAYVASQAPLPWTISDFFDAIVVDRTRLLVNLTKTVEKRRVKADPYWPEEVGQTVRTDEWQVTLLQAQPASCSLWEGTQRILRLVPRQPRDYRPAQYDLTQLHITSWPDFRPAKTSAFRELLLTIQTLQASLFTDSTSANASSQHGNKASAPLPLPPIWIHCSAGLGRTGTVIGGLEALKYLATSKLPTLSNAAEMQTVAENITLAIVDHLRRSRPRMVQGIAQALMIVELIKLELS